MHASNEYYIMIMVNHIVHRDGDHPWISYHHRGRYATKHDALQFLFDSGECPSDKHIMHIKLDPHRYLDVDVQERMQITQQYPAQVTDADLALF